MTAAERARALLDRCTSRADAKRLAHMLDGDAELRRAVLEEGKRRGAALPDEALDWPAKRLLRVARGRESESRRRTNPIVRDEDFVCVSCGAEVPPHGRTARDHCPVCLMSVHVDQVPGDRAASCGGLLAPVGVHKRGVDWVIEYRCTRCGTERTNRATLDGDLPDDWEAIMGLARDA